MKGKLIKDHDEYMLINDERFVIATTDITMLNVTDKMKLSKQNCDEIFGVVDVEKFAEDDWDIYGEQFKNTPIWDYKEIFVAGFNKAMKLKEDKFFTLDDIYTVFIMGRENMEYEMNRYVDRIHEPTEIEVEIETETKVWEFISNGEFESFEIIPKLDSNKCLILKKI